MNFYFDIETLPCQDVELTAALRADMKAELDTALDNIRAPSNYKDEAKIAEYVAKAHADMVAAHEAKVQDAYLKTSFDGGLGQVCVIAYAVGNTSPVSYQASTPEGEKRLLEDFFCAITDAAPGLTFVGHNIIGFDLPFLWKRCMILGVKPPLCFPRSPKPWSEGVVDTMLLWDAQQRAGGSMDRICKLMGIPGKGDMDGSKVWPMFQEGRLTEIAAYCKADVERTRAMHLRMTFAEAA